MKRLSSLYSISKYHSSLTGFQPANGCLSSFNSNQQQQQQHQQNQQNERYLNSNLRRSLSNRSSLLNGNVGGVDKNSRFYYFTSTHPTFTPSLQNGKGKKKNDEQLPTMTSLDEILSRASSAIDDGSVKEAIQHLGDAVTHYPTDPRAYGLRADLYEHTNQFQLAIPDYRKVIELLPESIPALSSLADCYASLSDYDMAMKLLQQAVALDKDFVPALGSLGDLHVKLGILDRALRYYERVVELQPHNLTGLLGLGHVALKQGSVDSAAKLYQRVIRLGKSQGTESLNFTTGIDTSMRLRRTSDHNPVYVASLCLANVHERAGRIEKVLEVLETAIDANPSSVYAHGLRASMYLRLKQPTNALESVDRALIIDQHNEFAKTIRADALMDCNRYAEAITHYREVIANIMERDRPEEVNTRIAVLHNMIAGYVAQLGALSDAQLDIESDLDVEKDSIAELLKSPENLQDLSKNARKLNKIIGDLPVVKNGQDSGAKRYLLALIDSLNHLALTANECLQIRHNPKIDIDKDSLLNPMESILYDYYVILTSSFATTD